MQSNTCQHGVGQLEEKMHIVNCNNNGQVCERFLNLGACP